MTTTKPLTATEITQQTRYQSNKLNRAGLRRAFLYVSLVVFVLAGAALLFGGVGMLLGSQAGWAGLAAAGVLVCALALLLSPERTRLHNAAERVFLRGQGAYRSRIQNFSRELAQAMDLQATIALLRQFIDEALEPESLHIFLRDARTGLYAAAPGPDGKPTSDLLFAAASPLVARLAGSRQAQAVGNGGSLPPELHGERARLALLGCPVYAPLPGRSELAGWLALGPRRSGEAYSGPELKFLEALGDQAALAVERTQALADLERRVREMNVLTRVAQGTNFTVAFDDMLELVYAQITQVIEAQDLRITLSNPNELLSHAFYVENDERLKERENCALPEGRGLEAEVAGARSGLLTDDYERECRARGKLLDVQGVYAWMAVPLVSGAGAIGAISVGSRRPATIYSSEQLNLLQAIADQTAAAIVKARLQQETERRARQLATLNGIAQSLTSTLELKPLLNQILHSATEILNCQAGSLFLVDAQTGESVFEVVTGPVAADLLGKRLPPGKGLVGQAVTTGQPILANDAKRRKEWFGKTDAQTGFSTQDLLVVPMVVKDHVIGVIEVINKADGMPFDDSDMELLATFTSQAAIAIENARLYTLTDQALAARVEELSVMQRIDQELNAGLDIDRAMRTTLEWAMRQSGMEAGLVGMIELAGGSGAGSSSAGAARVLRVVAAQGYGAELPEAESGEEQLLGLNFPALRQAVESGRPANLRLSDQLTIPAALGANYTFGLLRDVQSQVVIPIRREAAVTAVLLLETTRPARLPADTIAFLSRLCDHAAIALANARLYAEVQAANLAKSKFVSFVAHELKNPMSSIKGYTELVANGMAGPVNEMQASFLATVRSNVDRMNTIVSDLNDLTKIQVGSMRLEFKAVQLSEVVEEVTRSMRRQVEEKELRLELQLDGGLPRVWGDPARLNQVVTNLVSNAVKYTPKGGAVAVGSELTTGGQADPAGLKLAHVWVRDSGIGIGEEDQPKIFQQYYRTELSKEAASGTGLGLNITRSLVEMQGGRIWFESELGRGSVFHFTVPAAEEQE